MAGEHATGAGRRGDRPGRLRQLVHRGARRAAGGRRRPTPRPPPGCSRLCVARRALRGLARAAAPDADERSPGPPRARRCWSPPGRCPAAGRPRSARSSSAGLLIVAAGLFPPLGRAVAAIPAPIAGAMLAGVLLPLCTAPVRALVEVPAAGRAGGAHLAAAAPVRPPLGGARRAGRGGGGDRADRAAGRPGRRRTLGRSVDADRAGLERCPRWSGWRCRCSWSPWPRRTSPAWRCWPATATGRRSAPRCGPPGWPALLAAPVGGHAVNLAAITAALAAGPDAHPDPDRRWIASVTAGSAWRCSVWARAWPPPWCCSRRRS